MIPYKPPYHISGTDAPIIMGASKWKNAYELWLEKTGRKEREDVSQKQSVKSGLLFELPILKSYLDEIGVQYDESRYNQYQIDEIGMMHGHPDYLLDDAVIEIKTTEIFSLKDWETGVPAYYYWQGVHYMMLTGKDRCVFVAQIGMSQRKVYEVWLDPDDAKALNDAEKEFVGCLVADTPPATIETEVPQFETINEMDIDVERLCLAYQMVSNQLKPLEREQEMLKKQIKELLGDNCEQTGNLFKVSNKWIEVNKFDADQFAKEHPEQYAKYTKTGGHYRLSIKEIKQ